MTQPQTPIRLGTTLPDLTLIDDRGEPWRTRDHSGRQVVLILHRHLA